MPPPRERGVCKCEWLERAADDPECPVEFDAELKEYHLVQGPETYLMIYYCPYCGGNAPKSKRGRLFHALVHSERQRLVEMTKNMRTLQDVTAAFGDSDIKQTGMVVTTPERGGTPETTQSYPVMIFSKLSDTADVQVTIYPADRVGISIVGKSLENNMG